MNVDIEQVARNFSKYMVGTLSRDNIDSINRCNRAVEYEGPCASLFYGQSADWMVEAFRDTTGKVPDSCSIDDFVAINTAWQWAKEHHFYLEEP